MKRNGIFRKLLLFGVLLRLPVVEGLAQNLLVNGSFESPAVTNATKVEYPTNLPSWQTTATNFEVWTNGWKNPAAGLGPLDSTDGHQNLEIISEGTNATVWQTAPTVVGERYAFSFYYSPRPQSSSDRFVVTINSNQCLSVIEDGDGLTNFDWQRFTTSFVAASNLATLAFSDTSLTDGGSGTHIDGVVLEHEPWLQIEPAAPGVNLSWLGVSNERYQLQFQTNLAATNWINFGSLIQGMGTTNLVHAMPPVGASQAFYRLLLEP